MIFRASHVYLDAVINHPSVRPTAQQGGYRLRSVELLTKGAACYADDKGCALLFVPLGGGAWQGHSFAVEGSRGLNAIKTGKRAIARLFADHEAVKLLADAPLQLPAVGIYCRRLGLLPVGRDLFNKYYEVESSKWAV